MKRITLVALSLAFASVSLTPALSRAEVSCTRGGLQQAVDLYIAAQTKGDVSGLPLAKGVGYWENTAATDMQKGFITKPMKIDHHRSFFDTDSCQSITESIVTDKAAPYVFSTRLRVNHDKVVEVEILWTTTGYWLFDADAYLKYSSAENWDPIPAEKRSSRGTLVAAANAYLDAFLEKRIDLVPWGFPCVRVEGAVATPAKAWPQTAASSAFRPASISPIVASWWTRCSARFPCTAHSVHQALAAVAAHPTAIYSAWRTASCATCIP
jgi:hypothetical protein